MAKKPTPTLSWHGPRAASCSYAPGKRSCRAPSGGKGRRRAVAKSGQLLWPTMAQMATTNNDRQANSRSAGPDGTSGPAKRAGPSRQTAWPAARALPHRPGGARPPNKQGAAGRPRVAGCLLRLAHCFLRCRGGLSAPAPPRRPRLGRRPAWARAASGISGCRPVCARPPRAACRGPAPAAWPRPDSSRRPLCLAR